MRDEKVSYIRSRGFRSGRSETETDQNAQVVAKIQEMSNITAGKIEQQVNAPSSASDSPSTRKTNRWSGDGNTPEANGKISTCFEG